MSDSAEKKLLADAIAWWTTGIIDVEPGSIAVRGYPIQDLIGRISFTQMIWLMLRGEMPSAQQSRLLEAALVASVDHGPHAPAIAIARMAATCGVGLNNAVASGVNVLGDIHGGAGQQCMEIYESIERARGERGLESATETVLDDFVAEYGKIIPGFGHRFHPIDPRVAPLFALLEATAAQGVVSGNYARIGRAVEAALLQRIGKAVPMNIDGVTAVIFCELGFAAALGRGLFVLARSVGIMAHAWEQMQRGERIKGPMPKQIPYTYDGPAMRHMD
ncbi:MAG: citryl-CoA lyase [Steroidobacteraceae bacterium]